MKVLTIAIVVLALVASSQGAEVGSRPERNTPANSTVCYDYVGCFDNRPPFNNAADDLPQSPEFVNATFMLYTRHSTGEHDFELLSYENDTSFSNTSFDARRFTRVIVHGFSNSGFEPWVQQMKEAFLKIEDSNVVVVDWHKGAPMPMYQTAVANTRLVGRLLRLVLVKLVQEVSLQLDRVHLVGHSLGAHVSGYTGRDLKGQVSRITALDPAGPLFDHFSATLDLDRTDAQFVDVVHSNAKPLASGGAGLFTQIGHVDFYVNGGQTQPGCRDGVSALFDILKGKPAGDAVACSHSRSHNLFIESITSDCPFTAYPCSNFSSFAAGRCLDCGVGGCSEMGLYADQHRARGRMFLETRGTVPYCGFHYSVTIQAAADAQKTSGQLSAQLTGNWGSTELTTVTEEKEDLNSGVWYGGIVVASTEVGNIRSLSIRYDKAKAFLWVFGGGKDTFSVDTVKVVSGESGKEYTFCLNGQQLLHSQAVTLKVGSHNQC